MSSDKEILTQVQQQVAYLQKQIVYLNNKVQTVGGVAGNNSRLTNDLIKLFLPWLPFVGYINAPIAEADGAITSLTCTATKYAIADNDKIVIVNTVTGNQFDIVVNGAVSLAATSITFDSFTPTEDLGINCLILFKMERVAGTQYLGIDN